jgi:hypothetical protein
MLRHDLLSSSTTLKRFIRKGIKSINKKKVFNLSKVLFKGIPISYRAQVWFKTSGAYYEQKRDPDLYKKLLKLNFDKEIGKFLNYIPK